MSLQNQKIAINIAIAFTADWMNRILKTDPKTLAFISEKIQKLMTREFKYNKSKVVYHLMRLNHDVSNSLQTLDLCDHLVIVDDEYKKFGSIDNPLMNINCYEHDLCFLFVAYARANNITVYNLCKKQDEKCDMVLDPVCPALKEKVGDDTFCTFYNRSVMNVYVCLFCYASSHRLPIYTDKIENIIQFQQLAQWTGLPAVIFHKSKPDVSIETKPAKWKLDTLTFGEVSGFHIDHPEKICGCETKDIFEIPAIFGSTVSVAAYIMSTDSNCLHGKLYLKED